MLLQSHLVSVAGNLMVILFLKRRTNILSQTNITGVVLHLTACPFKPAPTSSKPCFFVFFFFFSAKDRCQLCSLAVCIPYDIEVFHKLLVQEMKQCPETAWLLPFCSGTKGHGGLLSIDIFSGDWLLFVWSGKQTDSSSLSYTGFREEMPRIRVIRRKKVAPPWSHATAQ